MYPKRLAALILLLVLISTAIGAVYYPRLPDPMATHWGVGDQVDGHMNRFWGTFFTPVMLAILWLLFTVVPLVAPSRSATGRGAYRVGVFVVVLFLFFIGVQIQVIQWNLGHTVPFTVTIPIGLGVLFIVIGWMLGAVEPNWVVGIRTYWTLKDPLVWAQTHERASLLFRILGIIYIISVFFPDYILLFMLLPALFIALYISAYSFLLYRKLQQIRRSDD